MAVRDNISLEKIKLLKSLNVELIMVDHTLPPDSPDSYNNITPRIVKETPGGYYFDQHNNRENIAPENLIICSRTFDAVLA